MGYNVIRKNERECGRKTEKTIMMGYGENLNPERVMFNQQGNNS